MMSTPTYKWWSYAREMIRAYPERMKLLRDMKEPSVIADYSGRPRAGGASRMTENLALASLGDVDREIYAVRDAIEETKAKPDGARRLELVRLYHWRRIGIDAAADACFISRGTALRWNGDFIRCVARHFGLPMDRLRPNSR